MTLTDLPLREQVAAIVCDATVNTSVDALIVARKRAGLSTERNYDRTGGPEKRWAHLSQDVKAYWLAGADALLERFDVAPKETP